MGKEIFFVIGLLAASFLLAGCAGEPQTSRDYSNRAVKELIKGDYAAAIADLDKAIELEPDSIAVLKLYNERAQAKSASGDHAGAIADYSKTIQMAGNPGKNGAGWVDSIDAYNSRAREKLCTGDYAGSVSDELKSYSLSGNSISFVVIAAAKIYQGDDAGAKEYLANYSASSSWSKLPDFESLKAKATVENRCKIEPIMMAELLK